MSPFAKASQQQTLVNEVIETLAGSIQAAVNAVKAVGGGIVQLSGGKTYTNIAPVIIPPGVIIQGEGWSTIVTLANGSNCNVFEQATGQNNDYSGVRDLQIIGNKANQTSGHGIYSFGSDRFFVENCFIVQCKDSGIYIDSSVTYPCEQPRIINNYVWSCDEYGVYMADNSSDSHISDNDIGANLLSGVSVVSSAHVIEHNTIWGNTENGLKGYWCQGLTITGNRIDYNGYHGVQLHGVKNSNISVNTLYLNSQNGSGVHDAINITGEAAHKSLNLNIEDNLIGTDPITATELHRYGIAVMDANCDYIYAEHNTIRYSVTASTFEATGANVNGIINPERGTYIIPSGKAGLRLYNTADKVTNYQQARIGWASNVFMIGTETGGTEVSIGEKPLRLYSAGGSPTGYMDIKLNNAAFPFVDIITALPVAIPTAGTIIQMLNGFTSSATSGSQAGVAIRPTYNQTSGTAANTDILLDRTQTAVGSGAQRLVDLQVNSVSKYYVDNNGNAYFAGKIGAGVINPTKNVESIGGMGIANDNSYACKDFGGTFRNGFYLSSGNVWVFADNSYDIYIGGTDPALKIIATGNIEVKNGFNIATGTTTGTKIGTATTQKIGIHGATATIQRAGAAQAQVVTTGAALGSYGYTEAQANGIITLLNEIQATLVEKGIMKGSA